MRRIYIDTSAPPEKPEYRQLFPILKKRIEARSGAVCLESDQNADFVLNFPWIPQYLRRVSV